MNIFYTSTSPYECAYNLCMVHVNKMIIETAQMMSTAHFVLDRQKYDELYFLMKPTHINHPSNVWVRSSWSHYDWMREHLAALLAIYIFRTGKRHKVEDRYIHLMHVPKNIPISGFVDPPRAMPDDLKYDTSIITTEAYQLYLDRKYNEWVNRERPIKLVFFEKAPNFVTTKDLQTFTL